MLGRCLIGDVGASSMFQKTTKSRQILRRLGERILYFLVIRYGGILESVTNVIESWFPKFLRTCSQEDMDVSHVCPLIGELLNHISVLFAKDLICFG